MGRSGGSMGRGMGRRSGMGRRRRSMGGCRGSMQKHMMNGRDSLKRRDKAN